MRAKNTTHADGQRFATDAQSRSLATGHNLLLPPSFRWRPVPVLAKPVLSLLPDVAPLDELLVLLIVGVQWLWHNLKDAGPVLAGDKQPLVGCIPGNTCSRHTPHTPWTISTSGTFNGADRCHYLLVLRPPSKTPWTIMMRGCVSCVPASCKQHTAGDPDASM